MMSPLRLKLTITVMSMGLALDAGGGVQQVFNFAIRSRMVLTCATSACAVRLDRANSTAPASQMSGLPRRATAVHLMSDATCTFTILSGSVTVRPDDPGGAFFNLSTTSIPDAT